MNLDEFLLAQLAKESFSACFMVLNNLQELFEYSIKPDFLSAMFGFSNVFGCSVIIFDGFTSFVFFFVETR